MNGESQRKNNGGVVPEDQLCRGWSRTADSPCRQRRVPGSEYCHYHGGKTPKGAAHWNFKDGSHSKVMPPVHLRDRWLALRSDPELAHHKNSIALVDTLLQDVFDHYEEGGSAELWRSLREAWGRLEAATRAGNRRKTREHYQELGLIIERGAAQSRRDKEAIELLEARRRHADSQLKRETADRHVFTYEEAAAFYAALGAAVRRHCTEEQVLAIDRDLGAIATNQGVNRGESRNT
jgi:hypothetical protein